MLKKKRKVNTGRLILIIFIPILCIGLLISNWTNIRLNIKGYKGEARKIILNLDKEDIQDILNYDSIINIEKWNKQSNQSHYLLYDEHAKLNKKSEKETIQYVDSYAKNKQKLDKLGYTQNILFHNSDIYSIDNLKKLTSMHIPYKTAKKYLSIKGVQIQDMKKYIQSKKSPLKAILSISYPGIDSSQRDDRTYTIDEPSDTLILVKNGFNVPSTYEPKDLRTVNIPYETNEGKLRDCAASALESMYKDAQKKGYELTIKSSYRSYEDQQAIYDEYFATYDSDYAASLVSVPGSSEHQCGLSVDLTSQSVIDGTYATFGDSPDYTWVKKNAYKYGFILRFPENASSKTGATNEPWHFRYVGKKAAKEIHDNSWILEDYIEKHGFTYNLHLN